MLLSTSSQAMQHRFTATRTPCKPLAAPLLPRTPHRRSALWVVSAVISSNDLKNGVAVEVDGVPYKIIEFLHVKPGKGAAFVRSKMKSFLTNSTVEKTFRAGESLTVADILTRSAQFTYVEGDDYIFMDQETYEETRLKRDDDWAEFLKEGSVAELMFYNGRVISVQPPQFADLQVVETTPNVKGNTASGSGSKPAKLETGASVTVPLFIEVGELIKVDTRTKQYLSRAGQK